MTGVALIIAFVVAIVAMILLISKLKVSPTASTGPWPRRAATCSPETRCCSIAP